MSRKWVVMALAAVMVLGAATAAFAAEAAYRGGDGRAAVCGEGFVDADADGICDNAGTMARGRTRKLVDADSDGVCDNAGQGRGMGRGMMAAGGEFVDADSDGVCDDAGQGMGRGRGAMDGTGGGRI